MRRRFLAAPLRVAAKMRPSPVAWSAAMRSHLTKHSASVVLLLTAGVATATACARGAAWRLAMTNGAEAPLQHCKPCNWLSMAHCCCHLQSATCKWRLRRCRRARILPCSKISSAFQNPHACIQQPIRNGCLQQRAAMRTWLVARVAPAPAPQACVMEHDTIALRRGQGTQADEGVLQCLDMT